MLLEALFQQSLIYLSTYLKLLKLVRAGNLPFRIL